MEATICCRCNKNNINCTYDCYIIHKTGSGCHRIINSNNNCKICKSAVMNSNDCGICSNCPYFNLCDKCSIYKEYNNYLEFIDETVDYLISNKIKLNNYYIFIFSKKYLCTLNIINKILYHQRYDIYNQIINNIQII